LICLKDTFFNGGTNTVIEQWKQVCDPLLQANRWSVFRLSGFPAGTRKPDRLNTVEFSHTVLHSMAGFRTRAPPHHSFPSALVSETGHSVRDVTKIYFVQNRHNGCESSTTCHRNSTAAVLIADHAAECASRAQ
jgi:hypothetical protein